MSKDRMIDDAELAEVTGGTVSDLRGAVDPPGDNPGADGPGSGGGGTIGLEEDNPGGGLGGMEQSE